MENTVILNDGTDVIIRPMDEKDFERSLRFFQSLPFSDRLYLRKNVLRPEVVRERIAGMKAGKSERLVAIAGDDIVADGALEYIENGWKTRTGEIRLIVARPYQRRGLGTYMARELFLMGAEKGIEEIFARMMRPQLRACAIFKKLGFQEIEIIPQYVKDINDNRQDLFVMRYDLHSMWETLEEYYSDTDWERRK